MLTRLPFYFTSKVYIIYRKYKRTTVKTFTCSFSNDNNSFAGGWGIWEDVQIKKVGDTAIIHCQSMYTTLTWIHNGSPLKRDDIIYSSNYIVIHNVSKTDDGLYICQGTLRGGLVYPSISRLIVIGE